MVGRLVDREGRGVVVYVFPAFGADTAAVAAAVEAAARAALPPDAALHLGGAPFVSSAIYAATQADMARLTPWAVAAVVLTLLLAFRDLRTVSLSLVSAGVSIVVVVAVMRVLDVPLNVVLGAMPVILFAVGSAYGIHLMARYAVHAQGLDAGAQSPATYKEQTYKGNLLTLESLEC
ncbi:MAG: MMPL family transporter, partial [bacterium]